MKFIELKNFMDKFRFRILQLQFKSMHPSPPLDWSPGTLCFKYILMVSPPPLPYLEYIYSYTPLPSPPPIRFQQPCTHAGEKIDFADL